MKEKDISNLLSRYEQMLISGKNIYFDADEYDELAEYYEKLEDIETAKDIVNLGLKIHPENESLMIRYAKYLVYEADYLVALKYLNTHFNMYDFDLYLLKIECFLQLGLYAEAHQLTVAILEDDDVELDIALAELGFLYFEAEHIDEAILYFTKSLEYNSENIEVLNDLVYAYEAKGDFLLAIDTCEKILDIDPYSFDIWLVLGKLYTLIEEYEKAIDAFDFALTLDDSNDNILKLKAHCLLLSEQYDKAIEILMQCIDLSPDDELLYLTLADCYLVNERYDDALSVLVKCEAVSGETVNTILKKAKVFLHKGSENEVRDLVDKVIVLDPESFEVNMAVGDLCSKLNEPQKAEIHYQKALSLKDDDGEMLERIVGFYINQNDLTNAVVYQEKLVRVIDTPFLKKKMALLYLENGDKERFRSYIDIFDDEMLISLFHVFYPNEKIDQEAESDVRKYILNRLNDAYEYRLLYKNIKF